MNTERVFVHIPLATGTQIPYPTTIRLSRAYKKIRCSEALATFGTVYGAFVLYCDKTSEPLCIVGIADPSAVGYGRYDTSKSWITLSSPFSGGMIRFDILTSAGVRYTLTDSTYLSLILEFAD